MTEFEINKAVSEKLGYIYTKSFDPCNNVEQAWEIMLKYNICVTREPRGNYAAFDGLVVSGLDNADWIYDTWHSKPLVAAMLCFLEMDE